MERARGLQLDGDRLSVEIDGNEVLCRYQWWSGDRRWNPSDQVFDAIARWSIEFRDWLDSLLGGQFAMNPLTARVVA